MPKTHTLLLTRIDGTVEQVEVQVDVFTWWIGVEFFFSFFVAVLTRGVQFEGRDLVGVSDNIARLTRVLNLSVRSLFPLLRLNLFAAVCHERLCRDPCVRVYDDAAGKAQRTPREPRS